MKKTTHESARSFSIRAADNTGLEVLGYPAAGKGPVVLILHGIASHKSWYSWLGERLSDDGTSSYLLDRRGAGRSEGPRGHANSWRDLVRDVVCLSEEVRDRHPGAPLHTIGFSLGSTISLATALLHPKLFDSQILLSPGLAATIRLPLRRRLRLLRRSFVKPTKLYRLPFTMDQLTDRSSWQNVYRNDPLRTREVSARFLVQTFQMQRFVLRQMGKIRTPLYALLAEKDAIVDNQVALDALSRTRCRRVQIEIFEEAAHNLTLAMPRRELISRIRSWILSGYADGNGVVTVRTPRFTSQLPEPPGVTAHREASP